MNKSTFFLISFTAFFFSVAAMTPASLVYNTFQASITDALPGLSIKKVEGSIWKGKSNIKFQQLPSINVAWEVAPLHLLTLTVKSSVTAEGLGLYGKFDIAITPKGISIINLNGIIQNLHLNKITIPYGLDLSGEINLIKINLSFDKKWLKEADGKLTWGGGIVHIQTPEKIHTVNLPALHGQIYMDENIWKLDVKESSESMMQIHIRPDGWAKSAINYAFIDLINLPLPTSTRASEDPAIVLEEKIL